MLKTLYRSLILIGIIAAICTGLYFLVNSEWGQSSLTARPGQVNREPPPNTQGTALQQSNQSTQENNRNRPTPPEGTAMFKPAGLDGGKATGSLQIGLPEIAKNAGAILLGACLMALLEKAFRLFKKKTQKNVAG